MKEHSFKPIPQISYAFLGDAANNMGNSLMIGGTLLGMDVRLVGPRDRWPEPALVEQARTMATASGGTLTLTDDPQEGVQGVDYIYTDVWVSMGEPHEVWEQRIEQMSPYQVNTALMRATGMLDGLEVTDEVFRSDASIVFDQAENRMHTIKALLVATLGG
jgi:ornithine carbamoyltransferase